MQADALGAFVGEARTFLNVIYMRAIFSLSHPLRCAHVVWLLSYLYL